ncbi:protein FERTILITY RESTORER RF2, mitochondrial [Lactuca sativa]|uniref:Uncharacterized protein n=1 Tax=Lactuca sativa TaxID=4236 RepID=A0A9R1W9N0_LACSA|nr:protein FERTILITY RESTORER RF2, mitochondrial [Lactuca sativa]KAJ0218651.1 hypothetical protein LSAT_V11C300110140 [Lactuca sativa]
MEISLISDTLTAIATKYGHGLGLSNFITDRNCSSYDQQLQTYALMVAIDAIAPPSVKPRVAPKKLARKRCRVKRSSKIDGGGPYVDEDGGGFFDGGDGPFGGGGGGGGGSGGNFDGFNWDESLPASPSDPAFDFIYEMLCWIVFSNCLHFAFKKVIRILADGVADSEREKVPLRFTPIC